MNDTTIKFRLPKALKKLIDKQPNSSKWCREAMWEKLENKKVQAEEWARHIDFLYRTLEVATTAKELVFITEMKIQIEISENWYKNIYGTKLLKKYLRNLKDNKLK